MPAAPLTKAERRTIRLKFLGRRASVFTVYKVMRKLGAPKWAAYAVALINVRLMDIEDPISEAQLTDAFRVQRTPERPRAEHYTGNTRT